MHDPDLLVLDEPFAGLDPGGVDDMTAILAERARAGVTVLFSSHQLDLVEELCEDVVIIDHGRVVVAGELADLRAAVPERFVDVCYRGPAPDWSRTAAIHVVDEKEGRSRLRIDRDTDLAALMAAVWSSGDVVSFDYRPPTLSELFRRAVAA